MIAPLTAKRLLRFTPSFVAAVIAVTLIAYAALAAGFPIRKLDLHDTGIWVSNDVEGVYGRLNKSVSALDALIVPPGERPKPYEVDILQDNAVALGWDRSAALITPINTMSAVNQPDQSLGVSPGSSVELRGGTIAVMDRTGRVWATRYDPTSSAIDLSPLDQTSKPLAELGLPADAPATAAALAVGEDGVVHAAAINGKSLTIPLEGDLLGKPVLAEQPARTTVQVSSVGAAAVSLDPSTGLLVVEGGKSIQLDPDPSARLQQPGPAASSVLVATAKALLAIDISGGSASVVDAGGTGTPAAPVRLTGCAYGAWAGAGRVVQACDNRPLKAQEVDRAGGGLVRPVYRINHGLLLLNDQATGAVWDVDSQMRVDNWQDLKPEVQPKNEQEQVKKNDAKPKAEDDKDLRARPDRTTLLHVLDNDRDSGGGVLSIVGVDRGGLPDGVTVDESPDAQTLRIFLPKGVEQASFAYTVSNGTNKDSAEVTVTKADGNSPPYLRPQRDGVPSFVTPSNGSLSIPVLADWRDREGDPVTVLAASDNTDDVVPVAADGRLEYTAPQSKSDTDHVITYQVTDDLADKPSTDKVKVLVLGLKAEKARAAVAKPDVARGEVGKPIAIAPLANDLPGADPQDLTARMTLAGDIADKGNIKVTTDPKSGQVVAIAQKAGPYFLEYSVAFGSAPFARGTIRVDAIADEKANQPVAMPDQAALRGQTAVMVDVLANDYDPSGALLTVQSVTPADGDQLQAAVIAGRWLRIMPQGDRLDPNPQAVHYTISNGNQTAQGDVIVTQLPEVEQDMPLVRNDTAVVRANDSVLIPVLSNDTSVSGASLSLVTNAIGADHPGALEVVDPAKVADEDQGDVGRAFVHGDQIRYVAPATVEGSRQIVINYVAQTTDGESAEGKVLVTIKPQPSDELKNHAPTPQTVEMRVVSGSRVAIPIPTSGQDPDGDSVTVTGVGSAPALGRVVGTSPSSLTYEAYPTAGLVGTDTFQYAVTDRYGATATGSVRVAVVAPGQTQPPVAMADNVIARPGVAVQLNVLSNDFVSRDDSVVVQLGKSQNGEATLGGEQGPVVSKAPGLDGQPVTITYAVKGNGGTGPGALATITSRENYINPPVIVDQTAEVEGTTAKASLLRGAWDLDGDLADLQVKVLGTVEGLTLNGSELAVPVVDHPQVIAFEVTDADGGTNGAVVFVPGGAAAGAPHLRPNASVEIPADHSQTFALSDYVESPRTKIVKIVDSKIVTTPGSDTDGNASSADSFTLTTKNGYVGPGSVTLRVMDANSHTEEGVQEAVITIPVQVGPKTPVLRCPSETQLVMQGGEAKDLDITTLCHVWSPNPDELPTLAYTATWATPIAGVTATGGGHKVTVQAAGSAMERATGVLTVGIDGSQAKPASLNIAVQPAPKPRLASQRITDIKAGTEVEIPIVVESKLLDKQVKLVDVTKVKGGAATERRDDAAARLWITPAPDSWGPIVYKVVATDLASDPERQSRWASAEMTLVVYKKPDAPGKPRGGDSVQSRAVTVSFRPGSSNGAPIEKYRVTVDPGGKVVPCSSTTCRITGLNNGTPYRFQVEAFNKAGWSDPGPWSDPITPDTPPKAPAWVKTSNPQDRSLTVSWATPVNEGSPIVRYHVYWDNGGYKKVAAGQTSTVVTGLDNNHIYTFKVAAENDLKIGKQASGQGQSSGKPLGLSVNVPNPKSSIGAATQVAVSWSLASPNGPKPVTYAVVRSDGKKVCSNASSSSCTDDTVTFDGTSYTYSVTATNATGGPAHSSSATSPAWKAIGTPADWGSWQAAPTGDNGSAEVSFTVPDARGKSGSVTLLNNGSAFRGPWSYSGNGGADQKTITGLNNGATYSFSLRVCNEANRCSTSSAKSVTPFGPLGSPDVRYTGMSGTTVYFSVTADANGAGAKLDISANKGCSGLGTHDFGPGSTQVQVACDVGFSSSATVSARLLTQGTSPARSNGGSDADTSPQTPPPPEAKSWAGDRVGGTDGYATWYRIVFQFRNFRPGSTVHCFMKGQNAKDWSRDFQMDGSGNWGPGQDATAMAQTTAIAQQFAGACQQA